MNNTSLIAISSLILTSCLSASYNVEIPIRTSQTSEVRKIGNRDFPYVENPNIRFKTAKCYAYKSSYNETPSECRQAFDALEKECFNLSEDDKKIRTKVNYCFLAYNMTMQIFENKIMKHKIRKFDPNIFSNYDKEIKEGTGKDDLSIEDNLVLNVSDPVITESYSSTGMINSQGEVVWDKKVVKSTTTRNFMGEVVRTIEGERPQVIRPVQQSKSVVKAMSNQRYSVNGNGTVSDSKTGLMWKQCSEGLSGNSCQSGTLKKLTFQQALDLKSIRFAGYNDWRVPTLEELRSLVFCSNGVSAGKAQGCAGISGEDYEHPVINQSAFPNTQSEQYWSDSTHVGYTSLAYNIDFTYGFTMHYGKIYGFYVRLVRGDR